MNDELLTEPTEKVVGVAPDRSTLDAVREALSSTGVADDRIEVLSGSSAHEELDPDAGEDGPLASVVRLVQKALGDEAVRLDKLNDAVEAGAYVVQVDLAGEDDDAREADKRAIGHALVDAGANDVAFYGRWQIEELQFGA